MSEDQPEPLLGAENSQKTVEGWLDRLGITHGPVDEPVDGYSWVLRADRSGDAFQVGWMSEVGALQVQADFVPEEAHRAAFLLMGSSDKMAFLFDLVVRISSMALDHAILPPGGAEDDATPETTPPGIIHVFGNVLVDKPLYCSDFFSHYMRVNGACRSVSHMFYKMTLLRRWN